ncbi:MAG: type II toxin-antitoxin system RelE/ParE family toxin [Bryobacterales bacterium]|nr:type II toxin-antitoxin system RelE/ParE family toxin [Bryobacterales bacterium]
MSAWYVVKPKADRALDAYADYLADAASLDVALRFFDQAYKTFALLAGQPNMGWRSRSKSTTLEGLRVFRISGSEHMLILYRPDPEGLEILRVIHGSRNLQALLRRDGLE